MVQKSENAAFDAALRNYAEHHGDESLAGVLHPAYQGSPSGFSVKKWTSTPEVIAARFETAQLEVARQPLVQALETSASAGKAIAAEHVLTSDQVIALLGGSGKAHAHEDRASEADLEKLRSSIKARIANAGVTSTEINSIVAELDRLGETELKAISGNIPQLIAAAANEAIFDAQKEERASHEELRNSWHRTEEAQRELANAMEKAPLSVQEKKAWQESQARIAAAIRNAEEQARARGIADWHDDPELSRGVNAAYQGQAAVAGSIAAAHPDHPELKGRADRLAAATREVETSERRVETTHASRLRAQATVATSRTVSRQESMFDDTPPQKHAARDEATRQHAAEAAPANAPAPQATTVVADATHVNEVVTGTLVSPARPVVVASTPAVGVQTI